MPIIERPNREVVNTALDVLRDTYRDFCVDILNPPLSGNNVDDLIEQALPGEKDKRRFRETLYKNKGDTKSAIDIDTCKHVIETHWRAYFKRHLKNFKVFRTTANKIIDARNLAAHPGTGDMPKAYARSAIRKIKRALDFIDAADEVQYVEDLLEKLAPTDNSENRHILVVESTRPMHLLDPTDPLILHRIGSHSGHRRNHPYNALTFYRIRQNDQICHPCQVSQP